ncbi:MAG: hypothetical protein HYR56_10575 [Acidobacteria bacterium]|nr:hypothetical protein [Acidobacteriota bacterium]MBI3425718.1 hypothetical protein [Acidobacteriota bacterium]
MKRQFVKMTFLLVLATWALAVTANAQDFEKRTLKLDFDFKVGDQLMPAGEYTVQAFQGENQHRFVLVRGKQTDAQALLATIPITRADRDSAPLTFSKYGEQHYLTQISLGDYTYLAIKSGTERKLARQYTAQTRSVNGAVLSEAR